MTGPGPCPGCGLVRPPADGPTHAYIGASPGCWDLFTQVLGREYGDAERWAVHALTVDAYTAQHPGRPERRTIQSVGVHLIGLALVLERGLPVEQAARVRAAAADRLAAGMIWLPPPDLTTAPTVAYVAEAETSAGHAARVREWAGGVWAAWAPHHDTVTRWIEWLAAASPPGLFAAGPGGPTTAPR